MQQIGCNLIGYVSCIVSAVRLFVEQRWSSDESARLLPLSSEFDFDQVPFLGDFGVGFHFAPGIFWFSSFPPSTKTNICKFQFDQYQSNYWKKNIGMM